MVQFQNEKCLLLPFIFFKQIDEYIPVNAMSSWSKQSSIGRQAYGRSMHVISELFSCIKLDALDYGFPQIKHRRPPPLEEVVNIFESTHCNHALYL